MTLSLQQGLVAVHDLCPPGAIAGEVFGIRHKPNCFEGKETVPAAA